MVHDVRSDLQLGPVKRRPRVHVVDGRLFVYDAESAASLLSDHRIWAAPVGVRRARNKSPEHNLPCVLSREQSTLVLRKDLADAYLLGLPCDISLGDDEEKGRSSPEELAVSQNDGGVAASAAAAADAAAGATASSTAGGTTATTATSSRTRIPEAAADAAKEPIRVRLQWDYPDTAAENKSMAVFKDLWVRGYCVASGSSYGADYVVYDGPPTDSHSVASVVVGRGSNDELSPTEMSGFARVQQAVAKAAVIAVPPSQPIVPEAVKVTTGAAAGAAAAAGAGAGAVAPGEGSPTAVGAEGSASQRAGREDDVRYVTLQFHSVSSRA